MEENDFRKYGNIELIKSMLKREVDIEEFEALTKRLVWLPQGLKFRTNF